MGVDAFSAWHDCMSRGDFENAWRISDSVPPRVWAGAPLANRRVLIRCQNGLGDTIHFIRYAALLRNIGCRVTVVPQPSLASLLRYVDGLECSSEPDTRAEVEIECTELPYAFRTTLSTIPANAYLNVPFSPSPSKGRLKVGLVWASGIYNPCRSAPLRVLGQLGRISGIEWISLQHGPGFDQLCCYGSPFGLEATPRPQTEEALVTARQILDLDLVISVDTMVAHLAGALAKPVWTLLPYHADWRWLRDREDSPWYPSMRLFRQRRPGDWDEVVERVAAALIRFSARACHIE